MSLHGVRRPGLAVAALAFSFVVGASTALAAVGQPRTDGSHYDRNATVVSTGGVTYLFFARSELPCNRFAGCDPDQIPTKYDLYVKESLDGGQDFGPALFVAANPNIDPNFRGRTLAATANAGVVYIFWANGGSLSPLYYVSGSGTSWSAPTPAAGGTDLVFNVEAVTRGTTTYVYTEELNTAGYGIYARTFAGGSASSPTLVQADRNIPKAIVDNQTGEIRMTYVDATNYPTVNVLVNSSIDGLTFGREQLVISEPGVSYWDPQLIQKPNGNYELHSAPDREEGLGSQRVAESSSIDFVNWSPAHEITPGQQATTKYWDYWPEAALRGNQVVLYYTSERATSTTPAGTGHIWTDPGFGGLD
jgi:hypothetical protein